MIVMTVVVHVAGLRAIHFGVVLAHPHRGRIEKIVRSVAIPGFAVLLVTCLHWLEAAAWSLAYVMLGAVPDPKAAMLYSLGTMTTFGSIFNLDPHWQMLGPIEALNGLILFGLTTAFLFGVIQRAWRTGDE